MDFGLLNTNLNLSNKIFTGKCEYTSKKGLKLAFFLFFAYNLQSLYFMYEIVKAELHNKIFMSFPNSVLKNQNWNYSISEHFRFPKTDQNQFCLKISRWKIYGESKTNGLLPI